MSDFNPELLGARLRVAVGKPVNLPQPPVGQLRIEVRPMLPPKPMHFGVFADNRLIAYLTYESVKEAVTKFEEMNKPWE